MSNLAVNWNGGAEDVTPDGNHDFLIEVTESEKGSGSRIVRRNRTFKVSGQAMSGTTHSDDFQSACLSGLKGYTVDSIRLWLRIIHNSMVDDQYYISLEEVWNALAFGKRYDLPLNKMKPWYDTWLNRSFPIRDDITCEDLKKHLYPAYTLDHWEHLGYVTKRLSYLIRGFMKEINPSRYDGLHVPSRILDQINAAKGSMRVDLNEALLDIARPKIFCPRKCNKSAECFWEYMEEVTLTKLWPFSIQHREAIQTVLDSIGMTKWTQRRVAGACMSCYSRLKGDHVKKVRTDVEKYWKGMCLDCVKLSLDGASTKYAAYFSKDKPDEHDGGCEEYHARNEWYHSFMGPQEAMAEHQDRKKAGR